MENNYDKLTVLSDIEHIRRRSGMYIGETQNPTHLFFEVFDNAIDEAQNGFCKKIIVEINNEEGWFSIEDNGRGFPQGFDKIQNNYYPIIAFTTTKSGGKFDSNSYGIKSGLNGVGLACVTALSDVVRLDTFRDKSKFSVEFDYSDYQDPVIENLQANKNGTKIWVKPSLKHFDSNKLDLVKIMYRFKIAATFIKGIEIIYNGEVVKPLSKEELCENSDVCLFELENISKSKESYKILFGYSESSIDKAISGSVNLLGVNQGSHILLLEKVIKESFKEVVDEETAEYLDEKDYLCGFRGFILVNLAEPSYSSQTKEKLVGSLEKNYKEIYDVVKKDILKLFKSEDFQRTKEILIMKFRDYRSSINKLNSSKYIDEIIKLNKSETNIDRSSSLEDSKLIDCNSVSREETELVICEGDSAGGSLIASRDFEKQAILPLRGKILNVVDKDIKKILDNLEVRSLINSLGTSCLSKEDSSKIRYEKIIIAADSDVDGLNIQALLIGLFCYLTPDVVRDGRIYIANPSLFGQYTKSGEFLPIWKQEDADPKNELFRFKGLGSYDAMDLKKVLLDEKTRKIDKLVVNSDKEIKSILNIVRSSVFKYEILKENGYIV